MVARFLENLLHAETSMALGNRCATRLPVARATNTFILHRFAIGFLVAAALAFTSREDALMVVARAGFGRTTKRVLGLCEKRRWPPV
jgi:hypothetical protein